MQSFLTLSVAGCFFLGTSVMAANELDHTAPLPLKKEYQEREARVAQWYAPARFGLFCHWGLFTGGGI
jgi:hypothetical protein